ncbi:Rne/Rng family ribonuclease [Paractinoplanes atraurantiacus]|uniref:Ribonuclease E n=1 Tax=Paractinoplanes atraurantiacus TaxID=1036182 RepID=A0A285HIG2_9ACTN|nr:Rne/Rng family ribonuclease [Actinoplanes atraurantiacus]SNY35529.1 ribonuclease E [Actinoplanes atraurantiacus]
MLDNEPRDNSGDQGGEQGGAVTPPDATAATTPARRTRAPRRKAAAAAAPPPADAPGAEPGTGTEAAAASDAASSSAAAPGDSIASAEAATPPAAEEAPVKPVKRTRRKAAAPAAAPAAPAEDPTPADVPVGEAAPAAAPVKRTRRKKAAAPAAAETPAAEPAPVLAEAAPLDPVAATTPPAAPAEATAPAAAAGSAAAAAPAVPAETSAAAAAAPADAAVAAAPAAAGGTPAANLVAGEEPVVEEPEAEEAEGTTVIGVLPLDADFVEEKPAPRSRRRAAALPPAVLFMPPDPTEAEAAPAPARRTRRGATSVPPAIAPEAAEAEAAPAPARRSRRGAAAVAPVTAPEVEEPVGEAEAEVADLPVVEEPAEGTRRTRRRRRGAAEEQPVEAEVTDTVAEPVVDEADESADDVEDGIDDESDDDDDSASGRRRRRRGRRGRGRGKGPADEADQDENDQDDEDSDESGAEASADEDDDETDGEGVTRRRRRRRRKGSSGDGETGGIEDGVHTVVRVREPRRTDEVQGVSGSTRLEAKRQRRRDGREQRRTRPPILSESEFLARREAVDRVMVVRQKPDRIQIVVLEDGVLVEHYVSRSTSGTMVGNVYLGKVQNVLPSMEAAFVDIGRGRNAVLYAGEVNWDATGLEGRARSIEQALRSGDSVLVQVTKDPIGHKGARLSSHIALSGRHLVYVPNGNASGISRKLPDNERKRLRDVLKKLVPDGAGVIVRTAAEGASEDELARDVKRLQAQWEDIQRKAADGHAPAALSEEPDLVIRVVRDLFNEDFRELIVQGDTAYTELENYLESVSPDLLDRMHRYTGTGDVFADKRIDEQILKGLDRKVFLPSGGHLVFDRTEAMTVVDVNTGKYTGAGGNLEETVTRNNLEAAEEIVRQLRLRDLGGIVVIDFIDMVLESNRELVLRRLTECLGRDRTKHQVTEITSLGLVQMTRKRIGAGLLEAFSETCDHCKGRGVLIHTEPVPEKRPNGAANQVKAVAAATTTAPPAPQQQQPAKEGKSRRRRGGGESAPVAEAAVVEVAPVEAPVENPPATPTEVVLSEPGESPVALVAELPPVHGSGIVTPGAKLTAAEPDDDYDISGYDLSRYEAPEPAAEAEPLRLTGADDPDAADDDDEDDDEPVGAGAGRRRSRRGGTRRRTRP